jgi:hypothetical protein
MAWRKLLSLGLRATKATEKILEISKLPSPMKVLHWTLKAFSGFPRTGLCQMTAYPSANQRNKFWRRFKMIVRKPDKYNLIASGQHWTQSLSLIINPRTTCHKILRFYGNSCRNVGKDHVHKPKVVGPFPEPAQAGAMCTRLPFLCKHSLSSYGNTVYTCQPCLEQYNRCNPFQCMSLSSPLQLRCQAIECSLKFGSKAKDSPPPI